MHDASIGSLVFFLGGGEWWVGGGKERHFRKFTSYFLLGKKIFSNSLLHVVVCLNVPFEITGLKQMLFQNW